MKGNGVILWITFPFNRCAYFLSYSLIFSLWAPIISEVSWIFDQLCNVPTRQIPCAVYSYACILTRFRAIFGIADIPISCSLFRGAGDFNSVQPLAKRTAQLTFDY